MIPIERIVVGSASEGRIHSTVVALIVVICWHRLLVLGAVHRVEYVHDGLLRVIAAVARVIVVIVAKRTKRRNSRSVGRVSVGVMVVMYMCTLTLVDGRSIVRVADNGDGLHRAR